MERRTLRDVMSRDLLRVDASDDLRGTVRQMRERGADAVVVEVSDGTTGLVTAADVLDAVAEGSLDGVAAGDVASAPPTLRPEASLEDAVDAVNRRGVDHLLVRDGNGVSGLVHVRDLVHAARSRVASTPDADANVGPGNVDGLAEEREVESADAFSRQSICEVCGSLADALTNVNGQLVCGDCQGV